MLHIVCFSPRTLISAAKTATLSSPRNNMGDKSGDSHETRGMDSEAPAPSPSPAKSSTNKTKLKIRIKRWHGVAKWTWGVGDEDEVCIVCQSAFEGVAPGVKFPGDECPVVVSILVFLEKSICTVSHSNLCALRCSCHAWRASGESVDMHFICNVCLHGFRVKIIAPRTGELAGQHNRQFLVLAHADQFFVEQYSDVSNLPPRMGIWRRKSSRRCNQSSLEPVHGNSPSGKM